MGVKSCLVLMLLIGVAVESGTVGSAFEQLLEQEPEDSAEWIRIPTEVGEWIWTHRRSIEALLKRRELRVKQSEVEFVLYTRDDDDDAGQRLGPFTEEYDFEGTNFRPERPTRVIVHGWLNNKNSPFVEQLRHAYIRRWDYNVIVVDWSSCAKLWNYIRAVKCVPVVGKSLAFLLDELHRRRELQLENVYIVGHSLGAHVAGIAGKRVQYGPIHTIVALDPALPLFSMHAPENRINAQDARYVEVWHTNGGWFGFLRPIGTADFYPNGGTHQPGCGLPMAGLCSHTRAWELFVESLVEPEENLLAYRVDSLEEINNSALQKDVGVTPFGQRVKMGGEPSSAGSARGLYFINTRDRSPFFQR
ncbi:phospholipase A1 VesT1.02-like [Anopheles ziemanni]|uniref:phospholipase A1 VesT1.02-like n=1 Tax=Anopheles coustani TaxID=139045 RepID=UPI002658DB43|nr:phospholipase A1 VesT1.02-like [Anopheles coustani]XP_058169633.1 phospholipase A1 VesT1.02-like [Anopheles ziemanni]